MPTFTKVNSFAYEVGRGSHHFHSDAFKIALTNTTPSVTNTVLADIVQLSTGGGYTGGAGGGIALAGVTWTQVGAGAKLDITDNVFTATASVGPFRYIVVYNDTSSGDLLVGWYDYGSSLTLLNGETFTTDFDSVGGVATFA